MAGWASSPYRRFQNVVSVKQQKEDDMSREPVTRQAQDEDTQAFLGHMTNQMNDEPEQVPDDRNRRQPGPERSPNQKDDWKRRKNDKRTGADRK
jgi:hypothetical protein